MAVDIGYLETLRYDAGTFSLRFPTAITPRYIPAASVAESDTRAISPPFLPAAIHPIDITVSLEAGFPLASLESP